MDQQRVCVLRNKPVAYRGHGFTDYAADFFRAADELSGSESF